jgi:RNA-directed DNA polymerase
VADRGVVPLMGAKVTSQPEGRPRPEDDPSEAARDRTQGRASLPASLARVNGAARRSRQTRFTALLHHVDEAALLRAFRRQRRAASAGVDGETVEAYEQELERNLRNLCDRVHSGRYRPQPVRRTYIPKADGGRRPLGVPALEDKIVQGALAEMLSAIYEADFLGFSYGFRPRRSAHHALHALHTALMTRGAASGRKRLKERLKERASARCWQTSSCIMPSTSGSISGVNGHTVACRSCATPTTS